MNTVHLKEKEQFIKLFKQEKIDRLDDRLRILNVFLGTESHITVGELQQLLVQKGLSFELEFVSDTLKQACHFGFAHKNRFDNGHIRYEHRHLGQHHDHMICTKCRKIIEFKNDQLEQLQIQIANAQGFHMLQHKMEIYGICSDCTRERRARIPLSLARAGEKLRISDVTGGAQVHMRLTHMGLRVGDCLEVITNQNQGQVVIAMDQKRFSLGRGQAEKIIVEPDKK
jgi:Fur family ferric uptake transcriptional regulator